ncbi:hypothetical protein FB567DRAFT_516648 [Paraphoma chrysanthemicola]|uniref:Zn(2)-C6 fungal-type domain-containing protein n=1 Tax=Paraphoma chrysanthemicola TaxID=798071 RepID=A0A8K0W254_9PLEO|nr:hypothetical protein FB567DRAFT_516648 [Paraphoma chrysanthemicola]
MPRMDSALESRSPTSSPGFVQMCVFCRKPFLKETSYKRHVLYCRRTQHRPRTRARACRACSLAKVKCNLQSRCSRCLSKNLHCVYDTATATIAVSDSDQVVDGPPQDGTQATTLASLTNGNIPEVSCDMYAFGETQMGMDWDALNFVNNDILPQSPRGAFLHLSDPFSKDMLTEPLLRGVRDLDANSCNGDLELAELSWLERDPPQVFLSPLPRSDPVKDCTASVAMQMLRAFPQMMLRRETFPPFIHGHWYRHGSAMEPSLPEPLVNCMGVAQVFVSHNPETRPFLWRMVQSEQSSAARKTEQCLISKHDLLAAIQAQLIYIMMRVIDSSEAEPGLNLQILVTYQNLCESFKSVCNQPFFQDERMYPSPSWEAWVFAESRRRTVVVWLLIAHMVHIKIGVPCDTFEGFREIPLPAPSTLWGARTRSGWQSEYELYKNMPRLGLEFFGDLIDACRQSSVGSNRTKLDAWNATVDSLGILLNLGAAMF